MLDTPMRRRKCQCQIIYTFIGSNCSPIHVFKPLLQNEIKKYIKLFVLLTFCIRLRGLRHNFDLTNLIIEKSRGGFRVLFRGVRDGERSEPEIFSTTLSIFTGRCQPLIYKNLYVLLMRSALTKYNGPVKREALQCLLCIKKHNSRKKFPKYVMYFMKKFPKEGQYILKQTTFNAFTPHCCTYTENSKKDIQHTPPQGITGFTKPTKESYLWD